jgi:hypothetical protein
VRKKDVASLGSGLIAAGLGGVFFLATGSNRPTWAWVLAWVATAMGAILLVTVSVSEPVSRWLTRRRQAREADEAARASYVPPKAREVVYNEGRWWLILDRGSKESIHIRCRVFDPLGHDQVKAFGEFGNSPVVVFYPDAFGIDRPLPSGIYTVVWTLDTDETARTSFQVDDDAGALEVLRTQLQELRDSGQQLLNQLPEADLTEWDKLATWWAALVWATFNGSPHLGKPEADLLVKWGDGDTTEPKDSASVAITHRMERIEWNIKRYGG